MIIKTIKHKGKGGTSGRTVIYKVQKDPLHKGKYEGKSI